ncbi:MAG: hypothetical protein HUU28_04210 [Planctomycetaceae bacterium]|nr:hypothetical protein [Planctomycetaceae bacterium]
MQRKLKPVLEYSIQDPLLAIETLVLRLVELGVCPSLDDVVARCAGLGSNLFLESVRERLRNRTAIEHDEAGLVLTPLGATMLAEGFHPERAVSRTLDRCRRASRLKSDELVELDPEEVRAQLREDGVDFRGRVLRGSLYLA